MGGTGCGKSSLVNLIPRLYDVTGGSVLIDGVDVRKYDLKALREMIGVVLQKMYFSAVQLKKIYAGVKRRNTRRNCCSVQGIAGRCVC